MKPSIRSNYFRVASVAGLLLLIFASCVSLPEPSDNNQVLVAGGITVVAKNYDYDLGNGFTINGTAVEGIELTLTNHETHVSTVLVSGKGGLFCGVLPPGNYTVSKITYRMTVASGGSNTYETSTNPSQITKFVLKPGTVANLGKIEWDTDAKGQSNVVSHKEFPAVKTLFTASFPESKWGGRTWVDGEPNRFVDFDLNLDQGGSQKAVTVRDKPADFRTSGIDRVVRQVPADLQKLQQSDPDAYLTALVAFLAKDSPNEITTVKRLHDWVADNISYDTPSFLSGKLPDQGWKTVLKTKLAVCDGYATLFKELCDRKGISCAKVEGYSRGYGTSVFGPEDPSAPNHAWNVVKVNQTLYLVDTTWDSGTLENRTFKKQYGTEFLFADPQAFLHSHYPANPRYQLVDKPLDSQAFGRLPLLTPVFFSSGIRSLTNVDKVNRLGNDFQLKFSVPKGVDLMMSVYRQDGETEVGGASFLQRSGDTVTANVALPAPGNYLVRLFKHSKEDEENDFPGCGELGFTADGTSKAVFPQAFSNYLPGYQLVSPLGTPLVPGQKMTFKIILPKVALAYLVVDSKTLPLYRDGDSDTFSSEVVIPDSESVSIATGKVPNGGWEELLRFPVGPW